MAATLIKRNTELPIRRQSGYISGTYTAASATNASFTTTNSEASTQAVIAAGVLTITPGFIPKYVKVINVTDRLTQEWFEGMNTGDFLETAANGDKTLETDDVLTVSATTGVVVITASGGAITDNDTVVWEING